MLKRVESLGSKHLSSAGLVNVIVMVNVVCLVEVLYARCTFRLN